jgi:hypothetical protein
MEEEEASAGRLALAGAAGRLAKDRERNAQLARSSNVDAE